MQILLILITITAGMTSTLQSGTNQTLQKALAAPLWSVAIISGVTCAAALSITALSGQRLPAGHAVAAAPWWAWTGGLLGLGFVFTTVYASPKLGAGLFMATLVTAELLTGLMLDHFGLLGFDVHRIGWGRIVGASLMIVGLTVVAAC